MNFSEIQDLTPRPFDRSALCLGALGRVSHAAGGDRAPEGPHQPIVRQGLARLLQDQPGLEIVGEAVNGRMAIEKATALKPDLVIADISLKDSSGLELMRNIKAQYPRLPILVVSVHDESIYAELAFRAGATGYLMKQEALDRIPTTIRRVLEGSVYVSDALAARMLQQRVRGQVDVQDSPVKSLSDRELEGPHWPDRRTRL